MKISRILGLAVLTVTSASSFALTQNFDSLATGVNASNAVPGLTMLCGTTNDVTTVGEVLTFTQNLNGFHVYTDPGTAWSGDNVAFCPGTNDILIEFDTAVKTANLLSDRYANDGNDIIRLVALKDLGSNQFEVLDIYSTTDGFTDGIGNYMEVNYAPGFTHMAFLTTTDQEGFDNLSYEAVPEPATMALFGLGSLVALRRKKKA